jgi:hypothetical protein
VVTEHEAEERPSKDRVAQSGILARRRDRR